MKKIVVVLILFILAVGAVAGVAYSKREALAKRCLQGALEDITGVPVRLENIHVGVRSKKITVGRIQLGNPKGFSPGPMAEINAVEIYFEHYPYLSSRTWDFSLIKGVLAEVHLEKSRIGEYNLSFLKAISPATLEGGSPARQSGFFVNRYELNLGRMTLKELSAGPGGPGMIEADLKGRPEVLDHLKDPYTLVQFPVIKIVETFNKGSLGLPRGKIAQKIQVMTQTK
ncbi:MAG: hypothetical protein EXS63_03175 [Candidatus Omnitrophica bacterium]|nr:hypothetical protein [Candidatus Omnitrophota bacterium]